MRTEKTDITIVASMSKKARGDCNSTSSLDQFTGCNRTIKCTTESLPIFMPFVSLSMKYLLAIPIDLNPKLSCIHGIMYKDFQTLLIKFRLQDLTTNFYCIFNRNLEVRCGVL